MCIKRRQLVTQVLVQLGIFQLLGVTNICFRQNYPAHLWGHPAGHPHLCAVASIFFQLTKTSAVMKQIRQLDSLKETVKTHLRILKQLFFSNPTHFQQNKVLLLSLQCKKYLLCLNHWTIRRNLYEKNPIWTEWRRMFLCKPKFKLIYLARHLPFRTHTVALYKKLEASPRTSELQPRA